MKRLKILLIVLLGVFICLMTKTLRAETVLLEKGWSLSGTSCYMDTANFQKGGIQILWKYKDGQWLAWSPNNVIMGLITNYGIATFSSIKPFDGFWVKTTDPVNVEFCSEANNTTFSVDTLRYLLQEQLLRSVSSFISNANGKTITIFEDKEVTCDLTFNNSTSTVTLSSCSDPEYDDELNLDFQNLKLTDSDNEIEKIVFADNNTLCVNSQFDNSTYLTSCAVINKDQPSDDDILNYVLNGSNLTMIYYGDNWYPYLCSTYHDNGTVTYKSTKGETVCNYQVQNGEVIVTCDNIEAHSKEVSSLLINDPDTGKILHGGIFTSNRYSDGQLVYWNNLISFKVENCDEFFNN